MSSCTKTKGCLGPAKHTGECATATVAVRVFAEEAMQIARAWARRMRKRRVQS